MHGCVGQSCMHKQGRSRAYLCAWSCEVIWSAMCHVYGPHHGKLALDRPPPVEFLCKPATKNVTHHQLRDDTVTFQPVSVHRTRAQEHKRDNLVAMQVVKDFVILLFIAHVRSGTWIPSSRGYVYVKWAIAPWDGPNGSLYTATVRCARLLGSTDTHMCSAALWLEVNFIFTRKQYANVQVASAITISHPRQMRMPLADHIQRCSVPFAHTTTTAPTRLLQAGLKTHEKEHWNECQKAVWHSRMFQTAVWHSRMLETLV